MAQLTTDLPAILERLRVTETNATELVAGVSAEQANWQPNEGRSWSVCQCLDHLAKTNVAYAAAMQNAMSNSSAAYRTRTTKITPGWFGSMFFRKIGPEAKTRYKAPGIILPSQRGDIAEVLQSFLKSHEPLRGVIEGGATVDLNRVRFKNPFVPLVRFTIGTALMIITAHDQRHLSQLQRVKEAQGYPRV
jgi:hypothetical protein